MSKTKAWSDGWNNGFKSAQMAADEEYSTLGYKAGAVQAEQNRQIKVIMDRDARLDVGQAYMRLIGKI